MNTMEEEIDCRVFRTNLKTKKDVEQISEALDNLPGIISWSVDLENWENVLRVEGAEIQAKQVISLLRTHCIEIQEIPI